jgi:branched-chain amino acid transport system permease protein
MPRNVKRRILPFAVLLLSLVVPPLFQNTEFSYVIRLLGLVGLYMTIALGLNLVVGLLGLLDLGFMAFYAIGAYTMTLLSMAGLNFWAALPASMAVAMIFRALLGAPVLRLRGDYLAIVTLGFGEIARIVLNTWDTLTNGPRGLSLLSDTDVQPVRFFAGAIDTNVDFYYLILAMVVISVIVSERLKNSRIGRAWLAIREDEVAARLTGIEITRMKMIGFVISAAFAGAAGAVFARWEAFVTPESFTFWESVMLVAMVVIGGMGSVPGTLLGVTIVMLAPEVLRNVLGPSMGSWRYLLFGAALILVAVFKPQGLWPSRRLSRTTDAEKAEA